MIRLAPLPGDPGSIRRLAGALAESARRFAATSATLGGLRAAAVWESPAGSAFGARVGRIPALLDAAAERYAACSAALLTLADSLERAQRVVAEAIDVADTSLREYRRLEDRATELATVGRGEDDPETVAMRLAQQRLMGARTAAEAAHRRAVAEHLDVDRRCAARLRRAAVDELADSALYRALRVGSDSSRLSEGLELPGMLLPPLGVALGVVNAASAGLLRLVYDEGSWGSAAVNGSLSALGGWGKVLRRGSGLGARIVTSETAGRTVRRAVQDTHYTTGARIRRATRDHVEARARAKLTAFTDPTIRWLPGSGAPARGTPSALCGLPSAPSVALRDRLRGAPARMKSAALDQVNTHFLDSWRLASAGGSQTRRMYAAGVTLEGVGATGRRVADRREERRPPATSLVGEATR